MFTSRSRLMLIAAHPDDESLACSVVLQRAVGAGAKVRVLYATDGENNPWPQRVLERKWRLNGSDRRRWGELRRAEAVAALAVLGVSARSASFLGLPDQRLTELLITDPGPVVERLAGIIEDWWPTDLFVPSLFDIPDSSSAHIPTEEPLSFSATDAVNSNKTKSHHHWRTLRIISCDCCWPLKIAKGETMPFLPSHSRRLPKVNHSLK